MAIIAYLVKIYRERGEKTTFALLAFLFAYGFLRFYEGRRTLRHSNSIVIEIKLGIIVAAATLMTLIALMRIKKRYSFPPLVVVALVAVSTITSFSRDTTVYFINFMLYLTGYNRVKDPTVEKITISTIPIMIAKMRTAFSLFKSFLVMSASM